jgi:hypothetical protein
MAYKICFFDILPVEILHILFSYLLAHEILFSFSNISDHVDAVLLAYSSYRLHFKSISKVKFDLICHQIKPDQVVSLSLSDDVDTPGQSELFLSRFRIEQFIRLQSLTLFNIEVDALESIFSDLNKLNHLRSFSFHAKNVKKKYRVWIHGYSTITGRLNDILSEAYVEVLPKLNRLNLSDGMDLEMIPLPYLRYLILANSTISELQLIFTQMPELRSLNVRLDGDTSRIEYLHPPSQLNQLTLTINCESFRISFR